MQVYTDPYNGMPREANQYVLDSHKRTVPNNSYTAFIATNRLVIHASWRSDDLNRAGYTYDVELGCPAEGNTIVKYIVRFGPDGYVEAAKPSPEILLAALVNDFKAYKQVNDYDEWLDRCGLKSTPATQRNYVILANMFEDLDTILGAEEMDRLFELV